VNGLPYGTMIETTNGTPNGLAAPGQGGGINGTNGSGSGGLLDRTRNYLGNLLSDNGPAPVDTSALGLAQAAAQGTQNQAQIERAKFQYNPTQAPTAGDIRLNMSAIDPLRAQQQQAISMLQSAANGSTPSAAELQQQQAGNRAAAQQFGMASALQGGLSPGAALRQASEGAANLQADTANNNAQLRAQEMAGARGQLVQGLAGVRGQEQDLSGQNAGLAQQTNLANLNSQITTTGQNQDWQKALLGQQENALNAQTQGATGLANANAQAAAAANQYNSGYIQQAKQFGSKLLGL
jgi:hypothetical protein